MAEAIRIVRLLIACEMALALLEGDHAIQDEDRKATADRIRVLMQMP